MITEPHWHAVRVAFDDFLENVTIVSKDTGRGAFAPFAVQKILADQIFQGLVEGIHWFVILKARQLGVSTWFLLLDIFWGQMFPGLQGAIIAHDGQSMDNFRDLLTDAIDNLPPSHRLTEAKHNRNGVLIGHGAGLSKLAYIVAGTQKKRGALGRSRALNYCHMTEVSSYGDDQGFQSLKDTFSEKYPYRLYCEESTARGFNLFHDEWEDAGDDTLTKRQIFLAWWMHDQYRYERGTGLFDRYGYPDLSEEETKTTAIVARDYGHAITLEQWAWYRHRADPRAKADFKDTAREDREEDVHQEYPSYPEEAFIATGSPFIAAQWLSPLMRQAKATLFKGYRYRFGENVTKSERVAVNFAREAHLKIFQEPVEGATYIVSADAAYASSPESDRYCAQVIRCYSDKVEQVAVFCDRNIQTFEFTWVIVDLCASYGNCRYILEVNASGEAVMTEFLHLKTMLQTGKLNPPRSDPENPTPEELAAERSTRTMLSRVRTYLYRRPDSIAGGYNLHWKTTFQNKYAIMVQYRDRIALKEIAIADLDTLTETQSLRQDGISIQAEGKKKDDRPVALALAVRAWLDQERSRLLGIGASYEAEQAREKEDGNQAASRYMMRMLEGEMALKRHAREQRQRFARKGGRWAW